MVCFSLLNNRKTSSSGVRRGGIGVARRQLIVSQLTVTKSIGDDLCWELFEAGNTFKNQMHATHADIHMVNRKKVFYNLSLLL